jgi:hypothetical protein
MLGRENKTVHGLSAPDYWLGRLVLQRALGVIYFSAFVVAFNQWRPLLGERGLLPAPDFLKAVPFRRSPSLFYLRYTDRLARTGAAAGIALAVAVIAGGAEHGPPWLSMLVWFALWGLYLSFVNVGQVFYAFGWETLLLEAGFLAIFLGSARIVPPTLIVWLFRWLLFRVEFGAGLIKLRGDRCWRNLTCLYYHHETQPLPNPLSWYFHWLPRRLHKVEVVANHAAQLVVPFGLFAPQPFAEICALIMVATQLWLLLSGNFSWLNAVTITLAASALDNRLLHHVVGLSSPRLAEPHWFLGVTIAVTIVIGLLSYRPVRNLIGRRQLMNASFEPLHLVNTYGAFGHITKRRYEIIIEGTDQGQLGTETVWQEYEFKAKPGNPKRRPPQIAPYHLRLDWLMWFAAMSRPERHLWLTALMVRMLENDRPTLKLLHRNPFPDRPPMYVRARLYHYRFTTLVERRESGAWWSRTLEAEYVSPLSLRATQDQ